jgi:surface antigen
MPADDPVGVPLPMNGYEPDYGKDSSVWDTLIPPVSAADAAECQRRFKEDNCTWYVAGKRPDVCQYIKPGHGHAFQWSNEATKNGGEFGVILHKKPQVGDIAVWSTGCGGTPIGSCSGPERACGHVALVEWVSQDAKTIMVDEMNWRPPRKNKPVEVLDCMTFISKTSAKVESISTKPVPKPTLTPVPILSKPVEIFKDIIDWLGSLFGG